MNIFGRQGRFLSSLAGAVTTLTLVVPLTVAALPQSATAGGYADSSTTGVGRSHSASLGLPHSARADFTKRPPTMSPAEQQALAQKLIRNSHPAPPTPVDPNAPVRPTPAAGLMSAPPRAAGAGRAAAPTDFNVFVANDRGAVSGLIHEPTVATNGWAALMTWNTNDAVSTDGGVHWTSFNPATTFPSAFGGLCCDQSAIYIPQFDLYVLVLQYSADANNNNELRIAVTRGASGLQSGNWYYYDYIPQSVGAANGSNWDQPKIAYDGNFLFIEATSYGATSGSYLSRWPLQALATGAGFTYNFIGPFVEFSPGLVQGAQNVMYFAAHRSTSQLRIFQWGDNTGNFYWNDVNHTAYNATYPYTCPRSGGNSTSDWCQRRSFGGGWAHTDRIFNMWLAPYCIGSQCVQTIGVAWDADSGSTGFGAFAWPYVQVEIVRLTDLNGDGGARSPAAEPYLAGNGFAIQYSAFSANALGGLGGVVEFGGGSSGIYESCSITMWDQYQSGWGLMVGFYGNADPTDTLSGDYLSSRGNGGNARTWGSTCYNLKDDNNTGSTGSSHQLYLSFGRAQNTPFHTLTSSKFGSGSGSVSSSPSGINGCTGTCSAQFINGTPVNLYANPDSDSTFGGWFGACSGGSCSVTMSSDKTASPQFIDIPPTAALVTPASLKGSAQATFSEPVKNVTTSNFVLRVSGASANLGTSVVCRNASNALVSCATGPVKNAFLSPTTALVPGRSYDAVLDPSGAPSRIVDFQGSSLSLTSKTFRSSVVEQENSYAATYQWGTVSAAGAYNGSYTHDRLAGASASYSFTGPSITWYTVKAPKQGLADVYIDGVLKGTVDNSATTTSYKVARNYSGLASTAHTIKIVVKGAKGAHGTGTEVSVDAFKVGATTYGTPLALYLWQRVANSSASGGYLARSSLAGSSVRFNFFGTGVTWYTATGPNMGKVKIYVDSVLKGTFDLYRATAAYKVGYGFGDLPNGVHNIQTVVLGQKNTASTGTAASVDRWVVE